MPTVETVSLDAGGVLVFPNWERIADTLTRHGLAATGASLRAVEPPVKFEIDREQVIATSSDAQRGGEYIQSVLDAAAVPRGSARDAALADVYAYHMEHNIWEQVPDDVFADLDALSSLGVKLVIASNANGVLQRMFDRVGLTRYFHAICDSCVEGVEKPDPAFFRIVSARAGGRPETTLHVGDLYYVDVVGARRAGMQALLLDPHDLYGGFDVERVRTLREVVEYVRHRRPATGD